MTHAPAAHAPAAQAPLAHPPFTVRPTEPDDWRSLKAVRLAALAEAPTAFGVTLAQALENTDQQWRDRAAGAGPGRFFLAFAGDGATVAGPGRFGAADCGSDRYDPAGVQSCEGAGCGEVPSSADAGIYGTPIGMVAAVSTADGPLNLIAMWVDPRWRGSNCSDHRGKHRVDPRSNHGGEQRAPAQEGQGRPSVADALINAVKAHARAVGAGAVVLEVAPDNGPAVALYLRHDFCFDSHVEQLASHPHILIQRMAWLVQAAPG